MYTFYNKVVSNVDSMGIPVRQRPVMAIEHTRLFPGSNAGDAFDGRLPTIIRKLDIDQLSDLHALFTSWFAYVSYQECLTKARKTEAKHNRDLLWSRLRDIHKLDENGAKASKERIDDAATMDTRFIDADGFFAEMDALHSCLDSAVCIASEDLKTISREVTRKQLEAEAKNQGRGIPGRMRNAGGSYQGGHDEEPAIGGSADSFKRSYARGNTVG
jgi:hypothetical protein